MVNGYCKLGAASVAWPFPVDPWREAHGDSLAKPTDPIVVVGYLLHVKSRSEDKFGYKLHCNDIMKVFF